MRPVTTWRLALRRAATAVPILIILAACAGRLTPPTDGPVPLPDAPLTATEIRRIDAHTAYDAVSVLRPGFLSIRQMGLRGALEAEPTAVYVNMVHAGSLEALAQVPASDVATIQLVKPMHTMTRLGRGHRGGAILVETRR